MPSAESVTTDLLLEALGRGIPSDRLTTDPEILHGLSHDEAIWAEVGQASVALRARSEAEVQHAVRVCADLGIPIVPRGAGTGLSGGANAVDGCVVLDLSRLDRVVEVDRDNLTVTTQPGVINADLKDAVAEHGLWYPPDPASFAISSIGGNVATNAGGLCCLKYGVTRDYVLGMRTVLGGPPGYGTAAWVGRRTNKGVAGYDLAGLLVGSEGTLGVITEVTLRLRPALTTTPRTVVGAFDSLGDAGRAVGLVTRRGLIPAALELLDHVCLQAVEDWKRMGLEADARALLLARIDSDGEAGDHEAEALVRAFEDAGARWAATSTNVDEAEALFAARRLAHPALERTGLVMTEDVCVPRSRVADMLEAIEAIGQVNDVRIGTIAHAGDGNLHPLMVTPHGDGDAKQRAHVAFDAILDAALAMGGTVTGEHGVGLLKRGGLARELDAPVLTTMRAIKDTLDPLGIFNPGKALPAPG